jgi:hypothetical protein
LKNSIRKIAAKKRSARMPYKRSSATSGTFLPFVLEQVLLKTEFFNSYGCSEQLSLPLTIPA